MGMTYRTTLERTSTGRWTAECAGPNDPIRALGDSLDDALENLRREIRSQLHGAPVGTDRLVDLEVHCIPPTHASGWSGV